MISAMRSKMGPKVIGAIIAVIAAVFVFYGIFTPGTGGSAPSIAGEVNNEVITFTEFNRALNQRIEFFKSMMGGKITDEQLEQFKVREAVFQDLSQRKVLGQIARSEGFYPSADQIREQILKMDVFKKDGQFDKVLYKQVLASNQYTPTRFEELMGQDIMEQNFRSFLGSLGRVSPDEVEAELKATKERRKLKYLFLDHESARKMLPPAAVNADAKADPKAAAAQVADQGKKLDELIQKMSDQILPALSKGLDASVNVLIKASGLKVKTSDWMASNAEFLPGVGSLKTIQAQVFGQPKAGAAQKYSLMGGTLFVQVVDSEAYDAKKVTDKERAEVQARLETSKQNDLLAELMKSWTKDAKIVRNDRVVVSGQGQNIPVTAEN